MADTEEFWTKEFGDRYHDRQGEKGSVRSNIALFSNILNHTDDVETIIEFGAGAGLNLEAIGSLYPEIQTTGIEINEAAAKQIPADYVFNMNMLDYDSKEHGQAELVFTKGLMIHVDPDQLSRAYQVLYEASNKYILMCEYYNPVPVEVSYRGHEGRLWKRDFCGDMLKIYPDLTLIDYGFVYHRDDYPQDDLTWFLMEKAGG